MNNQITTNRIELLRAYQYATEEQRSILEQLFTKEQLQSTVQDRVKTVEDACKELGEDNPLVKLYRHISEFSCDDVQESISFHDMIDVTAYCALRVVAAALNEGWQVQHNRDAMQYFPSFERERDKIMIFMQQYPVRNSCECLAMKSKELAQYFAEQFKELWNEFLR